MIMRQYPIDKIRNVGILGHGGCGKTSLVEAALKFAGVSGTFPEQLQTVRQLQILTRKRLNAKSRLIPAIASF